MKSMKRMITGSILCVLVLIVTACSIDTSYKDADGIAEPAEVSQVLKEEGNVVLLDARSSEDYAKGHVQGSVHLDTSDLISNEPIKAMMANPADVAKVLGSKGIDNQTMVYIYDNDNGVSSSRIWWTMKTLGHENVKVINNGSRGMELAKFTMTLEVPKVTSKEYQYAELNASLTATIDDVEKVVNGEVKSVILDVRSLAEFDEGAIPGAINYPHTQNIYKDGTFKSQQDIYLNYNDLGIESSEPVIVYCKSSFRATQTLLLMKEAGFEDVKVYDGAWLEWMSSGNESTTFTEPVELTEQDAS